MVACQWKSIYSSIFVLIIVASVAAVNMLSILVILEFLRNGRHFRVSKAVFACYRAVLEISLAIGASKREAFFLSARAGAGTLETEGMAAIRIPVGLDFSNAEWLLVVANLNGKTFWVV